MAQPPLSIRCGYQTSQDGKGKGAKEIIDLPRVA